MHVKRWLITVLAVSLFVAAGCGDDDSDDASANQGGDTTVTTTTAGGGATTTTGGSTGGDSDDVASGDSAPFAVARRALLTASEAVPNGQPFDLDIDTRDRNVVFEVKVESGGNETEVIVDATGTTVVATEAKSTPDDDIAKLAEAQLSAIEALDRAEELEPDARVEELEIDRDDGTVVWHLELRRADGVEVELALHAGTGDVVEHEIDD